MDSKQKMLNVLDIVMKQLSLLTKVGGAVAEVRFSRNYIMFYADTVTRKLNSTAKAITGITSIILDVCRRIPASHAKG